MVSVSFWILLLANFKTIFSSIDITITPISDNEVYVSPLPTLLVTNIAITSPDSVNISATDRPRDNKPNEQMQEGNQSIQTEGTKPDVVHDNENDCKDQKQVLVPDESNCSNYHEICTPTPTLPSSNVRQVLLNSASVKSCPSGTSFDSINSECVTGGNVHCGVYNCPEPNDSFPDPSSRHTFIQCVDDIPKRKVCKLKGTVFDNVSKTCIWDPDELSIGLKMFQAFIWLVKNTESQPSDHPAKPFGSANGYVITGIVAVVIPVLYLVTVVVVYKQFNKPSLERNRSSNSDEFYHRYYRRPTRNSGIIDLHPLARQATRNNLSDSYFVTSTF